MVKVDWATRNIYTSYDMPGYIYLDTENVQVRLKVYEVYDSTQAIYIDDTLTGTNRSGQQIIKIWNTNVHGNPSSTPAIYSVIVEIYDTNNKLIETRTLKYKYVSSNTVLFFKKQDNTDLIGIINYVDSEGYFIHYYGGSISLYYDPNAYIEFLRQQGKYYFIGKLSRVIQSPGTYNVTITPSPDGYVHYYIDIKIDNQLLSWIFNTPVISQFADFILWLNINVESYLLYVTSRLLERIGLMNYRIDKVEVVSKSPFTLRIYLSQDISTALLIGIIVGALAAGILIGLIAGGYIVDIVYSIERIVALKITQETYNQYTDLVMKVIEFCNSKYGNNPSDVQKCLDDLLSKINPPTTSTLNTITEIENLQKKIKEIEAEVDKWRTIAIISIMIAIVFIFASQATAK
jgi:hypothetical protein